MSVNSVQKGGIMGTNEKTKEEIIEITTQLLNEYNGDTKKITSRLIAERADIGLGSINYFFGSKENLIAECIQRIINKMLLGFTPEISDTAKKDGLSDEARLAFWASQTFDFLFDHQAIVGISILSDMQNYAVDSNSVYTQKGFAFALRDSHKEETKRLLVFILVSAMQTAFLARDTAKELPGYDLYSKTERDRFIADTINMLFHGMNSTEDVKHEN